MMDPVSLLVGAGLGGVAVRGFTTRTRAPAGLDDLVLWAAVVADAPLGVVLQKDGSLLAALRYAGPDLDAALADELDALARHVNDSLVSLGAGWMLHVDAIRRPARAYPASVFPDPVTQAIDDERRAAYAVRASRQFETEHTIALTFLPPPDAVARLARVFVQSDAPVPLRAWARVLETYTGAVDAIADRLGAKLRVTPLDAAQLLAHCAECLTGVPRPAITVPPFGAPVGYALIDAEFVGGFAPKVGDAHVRVVSVQGYTPAAGCTHAETRPGLLDGIAALPAALRWSTRIIAIAPEHGAKLIAKHQQSWWRKRKGAGVWMQEMASTTERRRAADQADDASFLDQDARRMGADAAAAAAEHATGRARRCACTQAVVIADPNATRADESAAAVLRAFTEAGFSGRVERVNAVDAFFGTLPGHGSPNVRRPLLSTQNVAHLIPLTAVWPGLASCPSNLLPPNSPPLLHAVTTGATPFRVNLHDGDVGHTVIIGKTGSGKSVLLGVLAAQWLRYPRAQVIAFDLGYSMWTLAQLAGGAHVDLAAGRPDALAFQPLARVDEPSERAWAVDWLERTLARQGVAFTPERRATVDRALSLLAQTPRAHRTLTELSVHLQDPALSGALRPYTVGGACGTLLDAARDDVGDPATAFHVIELSHLLALPDRSALPTLDYLFHRIEDRLDGRPTLLIVDEQRVAFMRDVFGATVTTWLLTLRKRNAAVVLATQDAASLEPAVLDSCPTAIYLPGTEHARLNARERVLVKRAEQKRDYYITAPKGSRMFELGLGPVQRAALTPMPGRTVAETKAHIEALQTTHGAAWREVYLMERGV